MRLCPRRWRHSLACDAWTCMRDSVRHSRHGSNGCDRKPANIGLRKRRSPQSCRSVLEPSLTGSIHFLRSTRWGFGILQQRNVTELALSLFYERDEQNREVCENGTIVYLLCSTIEIEKGRDFQKKGNTSFNPCHQSQARMEQASVQALGYAELPGECWDDEAIAT
jgi:hypothetical protein